MMPCLIEFGPDGTSTGPDSRFLIYMKEKNLGTFTGFAACLMDILSKKSESDIFNLAIGFRKAFYSLASKLYYYGQPFLNHVDAYISEIDKQSPLDMNHQAVMIYHLIEMRETALDPTLQAILNYSDSLYTAEEQDKMLRLLEKLVLYPSLEQDSTMLADDLIRIVFVDPAERIGYGENRTILVEALNYWMSEKFGGKVHFPEVPDGHGPNERGKASRRDFRPSALPIRIQKDTRQPSNKYAKPVAIPFPREILRHRPPDTSPSLGSFHKDDKLPRGYNEDKTTSQTSKPSRRENHDFRKYFASGPSKASTNRPPNKVATRISEGYFNHQQRNKNEGSGKITSKKSFFTSEEIKLTAGRSKDMKYYKGLTKNHEKYSAITSTMRSKKYITKETKEVVYSINSNKQTRSDRAASGKATTNNYKSTLNSQQKIHTDSLKSSTETGKFGIADLDKIDHNKGLTEAEYIDLSEHSDVEFWNRSRRKSDPNDSSESFIGSYTTGALMRRHENGKRLTRKILGYDIKKLASYYEDNHSDARRRIHHRHHHSHDLHHSHHKHRKKVSQRAKEKKRHHRRHKSVHNVLRDKLRQSQKMIGHLDRSYKKEKTSHESKRHRHRGHRRKKHHKHQRRGRKRHKKRSEERSSAEDRTDSRHRVDKKRFDVVQFTPKDYNFGSPPARPRFTTMPEITITPPAVIDTGIWTPPSSMMTPFNIFNSNPYPIIPLNKSGMVRSFPMSSPAPKKMNWVERNKKETRQKILRRLISKRMEAKRAAEQKKKKKEEEIRNKELLRIGLRGADKRKNTLADVTTHEPSKVSIPFHPQNKQRHKPASIESKDSGSTYKGNRRNMQSDNNQTKDNDTVSNDDKSSDSSDQTGVEDISSKELNGRKMGRHKNPKRFQNREISGHHRKDLSLKQRQMRQSGIWSGKTEPNDEETDILDTTSVKAKQRIGDLSKKENVQPLRSKQSPAPSSNSNDEDVLKSNLYKALGYPNEEEGAGPPGMQGNKYVNQNNRPYGRLTK